MLFHCILLGLIIIHMSSDKLVEISKKSTKKKFSIGKEDETSFIHISFDKLYDEDIISDDKNNFIFRMLGKASLKKLNSKCGRYINIVDGYLNGEYINNLTLNTSIPTDSLTISVWIWIDHIERNVIIFKCEHTNSGNMIEISYESYNLVFKFSFNKNNNTFSLSSGDLIEENMSNWVHVAATYNNLFGTASILKNGRLIKSKYFEGDKFPQDLWFHGKYTLWESINGEIPTSGKLDELYIFNSVLSTYEINYLKGVCNVGLDFGIPANAKNYTKNNIPEPIKVVARNRESVSTNYTSCTESKNILRVEENNVHHQNIFKMESTSNEECIQRCCSIFICIGYNYDYFSNCNLFRNSTINDETNNVCFNKNNEISPVLATTQGQWNIIFITISSDFFSCLHSVCNEISYEIIRYEIKSKHCFGMFCKNKEKCKIIQDSNENNLILPIYSDYKIETNIVETRMNDVTSYPLVRIYGQEKNESSSKIKNTLDKCGIGLQITKSHPSFNLLLKSIIDEIEGKSTTECIDICCGNVDCNIVYLHDSKCSFINCDSNNDCHSYRNKIIEEESDMIYIKRNNKLLFETEDSALKQTAWHKKCLSLSFSNVKLHIGKPYLNVLDVNSNTKSVNSCKHKCCNKIDCNMGYFSNNKCKLIKFGGDFENLTNKLKRIKKKSELFIFPKKKIKSISVLPLTTSNPSLKEIAFDPTDSPIDWLKSTTSFPKSYQISPLTITKKKPIRNIIDSWALNCYVSSNLCQHICVPIMDSYICSCNQGYELMDNGFNCKEKMGEPNDNMHNNITPDIRIRSKVFNYYLKPRIINFNETVVFETGRDAEIICESEGYPRPKISWRKIQNNTERNNGIINNAILNKKLIIKNMSKADEGIYYCTSSNNIGSDTRIMSVSASLKKRCFYRYLNCSAICISKLCSCPNGYELVEKYNSCLDIDECLNGYCSQKCFNTAGSYKCGCEDGFTLSSDGHSCIVPTTCNKLNFSCPIQCSNSETGIKCDCHSGFNYHEHSNSCTILTSFELSYQSPVFLLSLIIMALTLIIIITLIAIVGYDQKNSKI